MKKTAAVKKNRLLKTLAFILGFLSLVLIAYLIFLPLYPLVKYQLIRASIKSGENTENISRLEAAAGSPSASRPKAVPQISAEEIAKSPNRVIIRKIGVDAPIVEAPEAKWKSALNKGAWRLPQSSTPDLGGNTVISAHRYKYLPPNNLTFYLLDKLEAGDIVRLIWENKEYDYRVTGSKIVPPTQISILDPTEEPILTLFTCDPIWTETNRLVVLAELIE